MIEVLEEDPTQAPSDVHTAQIIRLSNRRPHPERSPAPELASDGGLFIFMFWYFHKGLEPHLQRAHAGHTQVETQQTLSAALFT